MKKLLLLVFTSAIIGGCSSAPKDESPAHLLYHDILPPKIYRGGDPWPTYDGESKRFTYAYENAWWSCIRDFSENIDHTPTIGDKAGNGWPSEVDGYWCGYSDAEIRVRKIINKFGKERARIIFQKALNAPEM